MLSAEAEPRALVFSCVGMACGDALFAPQSALEAGAIACIGASLADAGTVELEGFTLPSW